MDARAPLPRVTVLLVHHQGTPATMAALGSVARQDYPAALVDVVVVHNGSTDADGEVLRAGAPRVRVVRSGNTGFGAGVNLAATHARGEVLALLNPDAVAEPGWLRAGVGALVDDGDVACAASQVRDGGGTRVDYVGGEVSWFGMGVKPFTGALLAEVPAAVRDVPRDVLYATGAAMLVRAADFRAVGGFDETYFLFYEDVDLGWRLNLAGRRVRYVPTSVARHTHHASVDAVGSAPARESFLLERNALRTVYTCLGEAALARVLPAALAMTVRRSSARGGLDVGALEMSRTGDGTLGAESEPSTPVDKEVLAGVLAVDAFVTGLPALVARRAAVQGTRVRTDAELSPLLGRVLEPVEPAQDYLADHAGVLDAFGVAGAYHRKRVAVITNDTVGPRMAGPAIRAWHLAAELAREHDVRLVSLNARSESMVAPFRVEVLDPAACTELVGWCEVAVVQGHVLHHLPELAADPSVVVVADVYDPMHLEVLEQGAGLPLVQRRAEVTAVTGVLTDQLLRGDLFLVASERQRMLWIGHLAAVGRLSPELYDADPSLRTLLLQVPFGLPSEPPRRTAPALRGVLPGVGGAEKVLLWAGGLHDWFDPLTLVRAVGVLATTRPRVRLVFLGTRHPNPDVPQMSVVARTRALADELGLTGRHVVFNDGWVPYERRADWLLDADAGVTTHVDHVETTFAFRTRVLDYLWAGLPVVTTDGDAMADLVRAEGLGVVVPAGDVDALAAALERVLYDEPFAAHCREAVARVAQRYTWRAVAQPLLTAVRDARPAADRRAGAAPLPVAAVAAALAGEGPGRLGRDAALAVQYLRDGGVREVGRRAVGRVRRLTGRPPVPGSGRG